MKWLLCLLLIGTGYFAYTESQDIDKLTASLKQSEATVADLRKQISGGPQGRAAYGNGMPGYPPIQTPAATPSWMNTTSDLDKPAQSTRARVR